VGMQSCRMGIAPDRFILQRFGAVRWRLLEVDVEWGCNHVEWELHQIGLYFSVSARSEGDFWRLMSSGNAIMFSGNGTRSVYISAFWRG
jgi:hypothetical protein